MDKSKIVILLADDDEEDRMLTEEAFEENCLSNILRYAENGLEVIDYLNNEGKFADAKENPLPGLILLDLNMPKMDGREVLSKIKKDPRFNKIPVIVLTTSKAEEDILNTYDLGVNSFITKPVSFSGLVKAMKSITDYWFEIVSLPYNLNGD